MRQQRFSDLHMPRVAGPRRNSRTLNGTAVSIRLFCPKNMDKKLKQNNIFIMNSTNITKSPLQHRRKISDYFFQNLKLKKKEKSHDSRENCFDWFSQTTITITTTTITLTLLPGWTIADVPHRKGGLLTNKRNPGLPIWRRSLFCANHFDWHGCWSTS